MIFTFDSENETKKFCREFAAKLVPGDVVFFEGDLGAGKTFICKEFIRLLSADRYKGASPTFNLLQSYLTDENYYLKHYDLYRLRDVTELFELGIMETENAITLIEWPKFAEEFIKPNYIIKLKLLTSEHRECELIIV